jgi:hydroxyacylglutathione hydrolase
MDVSDAALSMQFFLSRHIATLFCPPHFPTSTMPHSTQSALTVQVVPAFQDNYLWLIHDGVNAAIVDPGDAAPVLAALAQRKLSLTAILLTHHHADHIGGVPDLLRHAKVPVFGPRGENIAAITERVGEGERIDVPGLALQLEVFDVPGHTSGHIAYFSAAHHWLFCGDTLFAGGCGRLFEGTAAQMAASLDKLASLPDETEVFCAHEYTLANLRFASAADSDNAQLRERIVAETAKRADGVPTIPSNIGLEKATNPFLRYRVPAVVDGLVAAGRLAANATPVAAFAALREWKNNF